MIDDEAGKRERQRYGDLLDARGANAALFVVTGVQEPRDGERVFFAQEVDANHVPIPGKDGRPTPTAFSCPVSVEAPREGEIVELSRDRRGLRLAGKRWRIGMP